MENVEKSGVFNKTSNLVKNKNSPDSINKTSHFVSDFMDYVSKHNISKRQVEDYEYYLDDSAPDLKAPNQSFFYRIHVKVHVRKRPEKIDKMKRGHIDDPIVLKTIQMAESFMHFLKETNAQTQMTIPWHKFVIDAQNHSMVCPALVLNEKYALANRECLLQIKPSKTMLVNHHPLVQPSKISFMIAWIHYLQGAFSSKYNFGILETKAKMMYEDLRPICRWIDKIDLTFKRFTWLFYDSNGRLIATVAQILNPNSDKRCVDAKNNPDLLCVQIEDDGGQCDEKTESLGYLTYYQEGKKFWAFALWSHGAQKCQDAKIQHHEQKYMD